MNSNPPSHNPVIALMDAAVSDSLNLKNILIALCAHNPKCRDIPLEDAMRLNAAIYLANQITDRLLARTEA